MAREIPYIAAINEAIQLEMAARRERPLLRAEPGPERRRPFLQSFGGDRVRVSPISETAEIGMAVGLALAGYRPVVEL